MKTMQRSYLGWDRPLLHSTLDALVALHRRGEMWDLGNVVVVVPVSSAARRLRVLLDQYVIEQGLNWVAPAITTVGKLPELLYKPRQSLATDLQQTLAWTEVLMGASEIELAPLLSNLPPREPITAWLDLAGTMRRLCEDLAADSLSPIDVIHHLQTPAEKDRWACIAKLHARYIEALAAVELADPQEERRQALLERKCQTRREIILVGCVDLGLRTCQLIEAVQANVRLFIGAPELSANLFDKYGRVAAAQWLETHIEMDDEQWLSAGSADQQAHAAMEIVEQWRSESQENRCTVGITDPAFVPLVDTELCLRGFSPENLAGVSIASTAPGRLLRLIREMLVEWNWLSFSALCRHADVLHVMGQGTTAKQILTDLDKMRATHFPVRFDAQLPGAVNLEKDMPGLFLILERLKDWLSPLRAPAQSLSHWCKQLQQTIAAIYDVRYAQMDRESVDVHYLARAEMNQCLAHMAEVTAEMTLTMSCAVALEMAMEWLNTALYPEGHRADAIPIAGWLDLAMDDSPNMVVVGVNHPFVPQSITADAFLPGNLRSRLQVADNERRFARDAYVLQLILRSRPCCRLIVGRSGPDGSPTPPSRLLSTCPSETTVKRISRLLGKPPRDPVVRSRWVSSNEKTQLPIPRPVQAAPLKAVSVTAFRDYLACPFRFYLRHVVGLRPLDDAAAELAANQFGDLVHAAVEYFGQSTDRHLSDADTIYESLRHHLHRYAKEQYGDAPTAAVKLQIGQAERRLEIVADHQAERVRSGWTIHSVETAVSVGKDGTSKAFLETADKRKLFLKGRIDRIDYHPEKERWAIIDYKTHGHLPMSKHYDEASHTWVDLQLPLYLCMLEALGIDSPAEHVEVGYFNIAQRADETGIHMAVFDSVMMKSAAERAAEVATGILDGNFDPLIDTGDVAFDDYAMIMQIGIAQNLLLEQEE